MIFGYGACPVDPGDELPFVIALTGEPPVLLFCPSCQCVWATPNEVETEQPRVLADFGLSQQTIRYASEPEIVATGHAITERVARPWWDLPQPPRA